MKLESGRCCYVEPRKNGDKRSCLIKKGDNCLEKHRAGKLVGTDAALITMEVSRLLNKDNNYQEMVVSVSPYGDGHTEEHIARDIK